jgi:FAD/FMN-containing dehydrogenase
MNVTLEASGIEALRRELATAGVPVFAPGSAEHARTTAIWNAAVRRMPALAVHCRTSKDIQRAVVAAQAHGVPLSVRAGSHDWAGRALVDGGITLDLTPMRTVAVDKAQRIATVIGSATANDLARAAGADGLVAVTPNVGMVGMSGFTLGGGYGPLSARFGLGCDNLIGAEVVLANGRVVEADADRNADLLWALRGGGGNFGVVSAMRIRLHRIEGMLSGQIGFAMEEAETVLRGIDRLIKAAPDAFSLSGGVFPAPNGGPVLLTFPSWTGPQAEGEALFAQLRGLGTPILDQVAPTTCADMLAEYDRYITPGLGWALRTLSIAELTPEIAAILARAGKARSSPRSAINMHALRGAAARVRPDATAFGLRQPHLMLEIIAAWEPTGEEDAARHRAWADQLAEELTPLALPGGYANLLGPTHQTQADHAYGPNTSRLRTLKQRLDPTAAFTSTIPLPSRG